MNQLKNAILTGVFLLSVIQSATAGNITGQVLGESGEVLTGANIWLDGTALGTSAREDGQYVISGVTDGNYLIVAAYLGYRSVSKMVTVAEGNSSMDFVMQSGAIAGEEVVISATRRPQKLLDAPGNVEVITRTQLQRLNGYSIANSMESVKGIHTYRTGIDGVGINARGFMTGYNYRFQLMTDGMNSMLAGNGLSAGHMTMTPREDLEKVEIVTGPSSALYGPNAHNGLLNAITRHPRDSQGGTLVLGTGENNLFTMRGRYAAAHGPLSGKINMEHLQGSDWDDNRTYWLDLNEDGAMDEAEYTVEGNDSPIQHTRFNTAAYYEVTPRLELGAGYGWYTFSTRNATNIGHNILQDWVIQNWFCQSTHPRFFARLHGTVNHSGDYYQEDVRAKLQILTGASAEDVITNINLTDRSRRFGGELQTNASWLGFNMIGGVSAERELPLSERTVLLDRGVDPLSGEVTGNEIVIDQTGIYGQIERELPFLLALTTAFRYDTHNNYDSQFSPRLGISWSGLRGKLRVTWNRAFQAPSVAQQYLYIFVPAGPESRYQCGNGLGFTLADGSTIDPLQPEINQTVEYGYRGTPLPELFVDVSYYRSHYENFISGFIPVGSAVSMGNTSLDSQYPLLTYLNFGQVDLAGFDLGLSYQVTSGIGIEGSISWIDDTGFLTARDEKLATSDAPYWSNFYFNTPEWKWSLGLNASNLIWNGLDIDLSLRQVAAYDFVTGLWSATEAGEGTVPAGPAAGNPYYLDPGPLGGFSLWDLAASYRFNPQLSLLLNVENLLDSRMYQMIGSPPSRRLTMLEARYSF